MSEERIGTHMETVERYCLVIGKNTPLSRSINNGIVEYECVNKHLCEKNGGCKNERFCKKRNNETM